MHNAVRIVIAFIIAVVVAGVLGSIFQTQLNLLALRDIAPPVTLLMRLDNTWHDLVHFAPLYTLIVLCTFVVAVPVAELVARLVPGSRLLWLPLGCAMGMLAAYELINMLAPMPTFIAATRTIGGTLVMLISAAIAGAIYAFIAMRTARESSL